jgi:acid phosphatase type 7
MKIKGRPLIVFIFLLISLSAMVDSLFAASLTRRPYLQNATSSSMVIMWNSDSQTVGKVWYGISLQNLDQVQIEVSPTTNHLIKITALQPGTKYYYKVGTDSDEILEGGDSEHYFFTSPDYGTTDPIRMWVLGDSGSEASAYGICPGCAIDVRDAYYELTASEGKKTDVVLMLGDDAYNDGTETQFQIGLFDVYDDLLINTPLWSAQGNHDRTYNAYYNVFDFPVTQVGSGSSSGNEMYFSFDYGNVHIISLNSEIDGLWDVDDSAMYQWLEDDLANNERQWTIAIWHHPPYTRSNYNSDTVATSIAMRENANTILEAAGVDLVLCGHSHSYERSYYINGHYGLASTFNPADHVIQAGDGRVNSGGAYKRHANSNEGTVYVVAGSSGWLANATSGSFDHPAMYMGGAILGSVVIDVDDHRMDVRFLREFTNPVQIDDYFTIISCAPGDFNCDSVTNYVDFAVLSKEWMQNAPGLTTDIAPDIPDGVVDLSDLAVFIIDWM